MLLLVDFFEKLVIILEHYFTNNDNLRSELRIIKYNYNEYSFMFYSDNGVFSKDKIDYASKLMLETYLKLNKKPTSILDVGCGYGYLGIVLKKILNSDVMMCDVNKRALHLAKKNIEENKVEAKIILSDIYENIDSKYDLIITNPPIRAGKKVVLDILEKALNYLNIDGQLLFVIHKDQGAKSTIKTLEKNYICNIVEKSKGFFVVICEKR